MGKIITVGVTGASGAVLARTTLRLLETDERVSRVHLVITGRGTAPARAGIGHKRRGLQNRFRRCFPARARKKLKCCQSGYWRVHRIRQLSSGRDDCDSVLGGNSRVHRERSE